MPFTWSTNITAKTGKVDDAVAAELIAKVQQLEIWNAIPSNKQYPFTAQEDPFVKEGLATLANDLMNVRTGIDMAYDYRSDAANACKPYCSGICTTNNSAYNGTINTHNATIYSGHNGTVHTNYTNYTNKTTVNATNYGDYAGNNAN